MGWMAGGFRAKGQQCLLAERPVFLLHAIQTVKVTEGVDRPQICKGIIKKTCNPRHLLPVVMKPQDE
ncbi:MAG: hypothetical protein DCF21_01325 [Leptolyngbya sp.]|nr:MAG: hypothetical protein DCF21_01325 [Leptolyngbya sp.]